MKLLKFSDITPGTWVAVGSVIETSDDSVPDVCSVDPCDFGQGHLPGPSAETLKANAHLLAAAPRLFTALNELTYAISLTGTDDPIVASAYRDAIIALNHTGFDLEE